MDNAQIQTAVKQVHFSVYLANGKLLGTLTDMGQNQESQSSKSKAKNKKGKTQGAQGIRQDQDTQGTVQQTNKDIREHMDLNIETWVINKEKVKRIRGGDTITMGG